MGCFDHAERQLGERCLYVFPEKVEPAKISCECPERNCVLGEGSVAKKVCLVGKALLGITIASETPEPVQGLVFIVLLSCIRLGFLYVQQDQPAKPWLKDQEQGDSDSLPTASAAASTAKCLKHQKIYT